MHKLLMVWLALHVSSTVAAQDHVVTFAEAAGVVGYASGVAVEWKTLDEGDVDYFAVLRRSNGLERTVATLEPKGNRAGVSAYRYIDPTPFSSDLAFVLRVVFHDGAYADTEWLSAQRAHGTRLRVLGALDQESMARLHINLEVATEQDVIVRVKSLRGESLDTYVRTLTVGENTVEIDYRNWPTGYYTVEVDDAQASLEWLIRVDGLNGTATSRQIPRS